MFNTVYSLHPPAGETTGRGVRPGLEKYRWMGLDNEQRGRVALLRGRGSRPAVVEKSDSGGLSPILERCSFACDGLRRVRCADHPASAWSAQRPLRAPVT